MYKIYKLNGRWQKSQNSFNNKYTRRINKENNSQNIPSSCQTIQMDCIESVRNYGVMIKYSQD
jgi:hypothetical protein